MPGEIAIIGMACRVPGASDYRQLWDNLLSARDSIRRREPTVRVEAGRTMVDAAGVCDGADEFDADLFRIPRSEAQLLDPQQRVFLEVAAAALADSGHEDATALRRTGVVAGAGENRYLLDNILTRPDVLREQGGLAVLLGNEKDHLATRLAYRLNLTGPAMTVQTSCSTSMVAVHLAVQMLRAGDADTMVAGGAAIPPIEGFGYRFVQDGIFSPDGYCRAFDENARGTIPGAGAGALVLRRLADAERDGDPIHAVIKGTAINNDGRAKVGYTAPSVSGQRTVLTQALEDAGLHPRQVSYLVAHGTGTPLGDAIELDALGAVYGKDRRSPLLIGSLKPSIGHLDIAAGVVNIIVAALAASAREAPPSLHCDQPAAGVAAAGLSVVRSPASLGDVEACTAASAFGLGGTNAHVILGSPPERHHTRRSGRAVALPISGRTAQSAMQMRDDMMAFATDQPASTDWADVSATLVAGRVHRAWRSFAVVANGEEPALRDFAAPRRAQRRISVGMLFPGHGSQMAGLMDVLCRADPEVRTTIDEVLEVAPVTGREELRRYLFDANCPGARFVTEQLAIFATQVALASSIIKRTDTQPAVLVGHSIGEYAAAVISGALSIPQALALVVARGEVLESVAQGGMTSVSLSPENVAQIIPAELDIAAHNAARETVVSGPIAALVRFEADLEADGVRLRRLRVSTAAHSRMLDPNLHRLREVAAVITARPPKFPWLSTATGNFVERAPTADYWGAQLRGPVLLREALGRLVDDDLVAVEVGVGQSMCTAVAAVRPHIATVPLVAERNLQRAERLYLEGRCELWTMGASANLLTTPSTGTIVHLPSPPLERQRLWIEPGTSNREGAPGEAGLSLQPITTESCNLVPREDHSVPATMRNLWRGLLGVSVEDGGESFFALGGESALLVRLSERIEETWGVSLRMRDLARHSTFDLMCDLVINSLESAARGESLRGLH